MRKPRDFDAELKALNDKAKRLKEQKLHQLGELVAATGADALPLEQLAGALLSAAEDNNFVTKEAWRKRGAAFFQGTARNASDDTRRDNGGGATNQGGQQSTPGSDRA